MQRRFFQTDRTKSLKFRMKQLKKLARAIEMYEKDIWVALYRDLNKSKMEAYLTEIGIVKKELQHTMKNLRKWDRKKKKKTPLYLMPAKSYQIRDPYGVVLIMSPWNYPFQLTFMPLIGAIAGGNCAIVKPSAYAEHTSNLIAKIIQETFRKNYITAVLGGREENQQLLKEKFDYIFFTGSTTVGKLVMEKAAKNVTPVTLELGGKSPAILDQKVNFNQAAKRIVFGKYTNAGQTCVAPDYLLVHKKDKETLVANLKKWIDRFYPKDQNGFIADYPKIINEKHMRRIIAYLNDGSIEIGGRYDEEKRYMEPTVLAEISWDDSIMGEEIFGPILPILEYEDLDQVLSTLKNKPKPLALYLFTKKKRTEKKVSDQLSFGGGCVNDVIMHLASHYLSFGGVGESGMGSYHGEKSYQTFTHEKSVLKKSMLLDLPIRYRPYTNCKEKIIRKIL
ncbi:MAG TPA: aldehyde dehydrogenase family protein [Eubacteriaceae bacterium]|nr:aldehyde dehydrogenase family protein [Eubacteriaceae bacterium]